MNEQRLKFSDIFKVYPDGSIEPVRNVKIGGIQFGPGVRFGKGISFSGVDVSLYVGRDLLTEEQDGTLVIKGIY